MKTTQKTPQQGAVERRPVADAIAAAATSQTQSEAPKGQSSATFLLLCFGIPALLMIVLAVLLK